MKIAFVASELAPLAKVGGLGDVAFALPQALRRMGHEVWHFLPKYATVSAYLETEQIPIIDSLHFAVDIANERYGVTLQLVHVQEAPVYLVEQPFLFERKGIYHDEVGHRAYTDDLQRQLCFCLAVLEALRRWKLQVDVIHNHDWHTGLLSLLLKLRYSKDTLFRKTRNVFTIHNLAYQGTFPMEECQHIEALLPDHAAVNVLHQGQLNCMKAGIVYADSVTTVSPNYALEILTPEYGEGLDTLLHLRHKQGQFSGVLNGIDYQEWNPSQDAHLLPEGFSREDLSGKLRLKQAFLQQHLPSAPESAFVWVSISRLVAQKGWDILVPSLERFFAETEHVTCLILGHGDPQIEEQIHALAQAFPDRICFFAQFDAQRAHELEAIGDLFLMPSRFEPCGLNQMYSMRYGTAPLVRKTGGLADTVTDGETGFVFEDYTSDALMEAMRRAVDSFANPDVWQTLQQRMMQQDLSWDRSATRYLHLYQARSES